LYLNRNKLDNCKNNLRQVDEYQNSINRTNVKGMYWDKQRQLWCVRITVKSKCIYIGRFKNRRDAVNARKKAEIKYFGEYRAI